MQRLIARVSGKVQRAGYRGKVVTIAKAFGLHGYVQNLPDGRVKVVAEGSVADLERFAGSLVIKNSIINVTGVEKQLMPATGEYEGFAKIVDEGETDSRLDAAIGHLKDIAELTQVSVSLQKMMLDKQDQMLEKQDRLLDKQDQMLEKQDRMLDKQDQMLGIQGQMLGKLDQSEENIILKLDEVSESVVGEIRELRSDIKPLAEDRLTRIESDLSQIKAKIGL